jgi:hypothetical protein
MPESIVDLPKSNRICHGQRGIGPAPFFDLKRSSELTGTVQRMNASIARRLDIGFWAWKDHGDTGVNVGIVMNCDLTNANTLDIENGVFGAWRKLAW